MSKLDIKCLDEGYSFVDICGLPLYRGSGLKCFGGFIGVVVCCLPLYRGSGLKYFIRRTTSAPFMVFLCIEEVD